MELEFGKLSSRQFQEVRRFLQQQGLEPPVILRDNTVVLRFCNILRFPKGFRARACATR